MVLMNYTIPKAGTSSKLAVVVVLGAIIVLAALSIIMFYLGRQSVFDHYIVTPRLPR